MVITTETFHTGSALRALRLVHKARQCAKRKDVTGMFNYTEMACATCIDAPRVRIADMGKDNVIAHKYTYQIKKLSVISDKGKCETYVRHTRYLKCELHELIRALQGRTTRGLWS